MRQGLTCDPPLQEASGMAKERLAAGCDGGESNRVAAQGILPLRKGRRVEGAHDLFVRGAAQRHDSGTWRHGRRPVHRDGPGGAETAGREDRRGDFSGRTCSRHGRCARCEQEGAERAEVFPAGNLRARQACSDRQEHLAGAGKPQRGSIAAIQSRTRARPSGSGTLRPSSGIATPGSVEAMR